MTPPEPVRTPTGVPLEVDDATLAAWLADDLGEPPRDVTSAPIFPETHESRARIVAREALVVSGLDEARRLFRLAGAAPTTRQADGERVEAGAVLATVAGPTRAILLAERTALNVLGRMSGIATTTHTIQELVAAVNPRCRVAATRKTTPGFRRLEKKAVVHGGGDPHRYGLFDQVLVKDNHRAARGDLPELLAALREARHDELIEVEVETEADALTAARAGAQILLLDNRDPAEAERIARAARGVAPGVRIEVSGGITAANAADYARFADRISMGHLTQGARAADVALDWDPIA